jgi:hypothetical protein
VAVRGGRGSGLADARIETEVGGRDCPSFCV